MSDSTSPAGDPNPPVEYLGTQPTGSEGRSDGSSGRRGRRRGFALAAGVGVLAVVGAGAWGVTSYLGGGGPAPAIAVPDDALAYVALDLDPSAGQKVEAYRTLRKFPALKDRIGVSEDPRRTLYDVFTSASGCDGIDYDDDVAPWLGDRLAFAVRPSADHPDMFFAVQVKDRALAEDGIAKAFGCADTSAGTAPVGDDYLVVAETDEIAADIAADARAGALADDETFQDRVDDAGGQGIVTAYAAPDAPRQLSEGMLGGLSPLSSMSSGSDSGSSSGSGSAMPYRADPAAHRLESGDLPSVEASPVPSTVPSDLPSAVSSDLPLEPTPGGMGEETPLTDAFDDFDGAALSVRFDDGALQLELAGSGLGALTGESGGEGAGGVSDLPGSTAAGAGFAVPDDYVQSLSDRLASMLGAHERDQLFSEMSDQLGLSVPGDLQTLLGDGVALGLDSSADLGTFFGSGEPTGLPAGLRITGDPDEIRPVLDKIVAAAGADGAKLTVVDGDGVVAVGFDPDYVARLAQDGDLGDQDFFDTALPEADGSSGALFANFDAGDWVSGLADGSDEVRQNLEPLSSLGITAEHDDDTFHATIRLTTD